MTVKRIALLAIAAAVSPVSAFAFSPRPNVVSSSSVKGSYGVASPQRQVIK
jgi:hypothetical protein